MSKKVDERVVSMEFDNKKFEANVKTSMSTIDKLKKSLNFDSAAKGFDNLNKASKNLSLDSIAAGVESLQKRFSTFGIVGMRVIENITDSMIRLSSKTMSFLTEGIVQGGKRRAMNLENAHFQLQGLLKDEEAVAAVMQNVSDSVDGTAYSLDSAAKVASQLAASGMKAGDQMFSSLRAVAGVAAMTNSEYDEIGRIFTKVAGQGRLMGDDLLSLSSRGMNAAATLAEAMGTTESAVREMVSKGQIDFQTFASAMDNAFGEHAKKANETLTGALSNVKAALARIGALFVSPLVEQNGELVQLLNAVRVKINDIKTAMGPIADFTTNIIKNLATRLTEFVNKLNVKKPFEKISEMLTSSKWDVFIKKLNDAGISTDKFQEKLTEVAKKHGISVDDLIKKYGSLGKVMAAGKISKNIIIETLKKFVGVEKEASKATTDVTDKLEYFNKVIKQVVRGDFGNGEARIKAMTAASHDYAAVQKLVNYVWERNGKTWSNCSVSAEELTKVIGDMSTEELKSIGYTEEQAKKIRELAEEAEKSGTPLNELLSSLEKPTGKELVIDTFRNALKGLSTVISSVKKAWSEVFSSSKTSGALYGMIEAIHKLSEKFVFSEKRADKLKRTFKGLFAALDIVRMLVGGALNVAFKVLKAVLSAFNIDLLDVTATIGDAIVKFRDWLKEHDLLKQAIEFLAPIIKAIATTIKEAAVAVYEWAKNNETLQRIFKSISSWIDGASKSIQKWTQGLKETDNIPKYIISGLVNGLKNGVATVVSCMIELGKGILEAIKGVLGIHSPSTEFFEIGKNVIAGFVNGIQNGASTAWEALKKFGQKCIDIIKNIDFGAVLTVTFVGGLLFTANKFANALDKFGSLFSGLGSMFSNIGNGINELLTGIGKQFKAKALETRSKAILNFAKAIAILAASVYVLAKLKAGDLWKAVGVIGALTALIVGLAFAIDKMKFDDPVQIGKVVLIVLGLAAVLLQLSKAMKNLAGLSWDEYAVGAAALGTLAAFITGLIAATKLAGKDIDKVGGVLLKISVAMLLLVFVIKQISKLEPAALIKGISVMVVLGGFIAGLIAATKLAGKDIDKVGGTLLKISAAMILLVIAIKLISGLDGAAIAKGLAVIVAFGGIVTGLIAATKLAGKGEIAKIGGTILGISAAMMLMAITMRMVSGMDTQSIIKGLVVITAFGAIIAGLIAATQLAGDNLTKVGATILMASIAIGILAGVSVLLGMVKLEHLAKGIVAVGLLSAMMIGLIKATEKSKDCMKNLIVLTVAISILVAALVGLSFIDPANLASATLAIDSVMGMFALLILASKSLKDAKSLIGPMSIMVGVVAALGIIIYELAKLDPDSTLEIAASLSLLLLSMSASLAVLSMIGKTFKAKDIALGILSLTAMAVPMLAFVGVLAVMSMVSKATENAKALTALMTTMTILLIPLSAIGALVFLTSGIILLGIAALAAMAVPMLAFVGVLAVMSGIEGATKNAYLLIDLMTAMSDILVRISIVAPLAMLGVTALTALTGLMVGIGALAIAVGALMEKFPALEDFLDRGLPILSKLAYGVGNIVGSLVAGFSTAIADSLPHIGECLSQFMTNLMPFIAGAKQIDEQVLKGVGILAASILALTVAELISGVVSFLPYTTSFADMGAQLSQFMTNLAPFIEGVKAVDDQVIKGVNALAEAILVLTVARLLDGITTIISFGASLSDLGTQLSGFMTNAKPFIDGANQINPEMMEGVKTLAEALMLITGAKLLEGVTKFLTGGSSMEAFGTQLGQLGTGINNFVTNVGSLTDEQVAIAERAAKIIKTLATAASEIPNSGGWLGAIVGNNDMDVWANQLPTVAEGIAKFTNTLVNAGLSEDSVNIANNAAKIIKTLAEAASEIPNAGGMLAGLVGDNDFGPWAQQLPKVGEGIAGFTNTLANAGITEDGVGIANTAAKIIKTLAQAASEIPNAGGLLAGIVGDNDFSTWATQLPKVGEGVAGFADALGTFGEDKLATVNAAVNAIKVIANMSKDYGAIKDAGDFSSFGNGMITLAKKVKEFADKMSEVSEESITSAKKKIKDVINLAKDLGKVDTKSLTSFGNSLKKAGTDGIKKFISAFTDSNTAADIKKAAASMMSKAKEGIKSKNDELKKAASDSAKKVADGLKSKKEDVKKAGEDLVKKAASAIKTEEQKEKFKSAGKYLGEGLVEGIKAKEQAAYDAGYALGQKAVQGEKDGQQSESPSKLTIKAGKWLGEGLVIGMRKMGDAVYKSGYGLGEIATETISSAISSIADVVNTDIDTQPTIRPVVDLSDVTAGAGAINGLFTMQPSIGVLSRARSISSMMNENQNGDNSDVISAIKDLGHKIEGSSGNTYNVNGITYDDGTNVSNAIGELVRAVKIEGRT